MKLLLIRTVSDDQGTFGQLEVNGVKLHSGELPWRANQHEVSCIPNGLYSCVWAYSPHFKKELYHVQNVRDRDSILIHPANYMGDKSKGFKSDLEGCISLGMSLGSGGQRTLLRSTEALKLFEDYLNKVTFDLEISYL